MSSGSGSGPVDERGAALLDPSGGAGVVRTFRDEVARLVRPPLVDLGTIAVNATTVTLCWFLLPQSWREWLFDNLHGRIAFAVVLGTWMLSDTTSTNLLGNDRTSAVAALRGQVSLVRVMVVKILVLGTGIGTVSVAVAAILARGAPGANRLWAVAPSLVSVPVGVVAVASLVGVVAPFRVRSASWRWRHRRDHRSTARWLVLVAVPYFGVGPLAAGFLVPSKWLADQITGHSGEGRPPSGTVAVMSGISVVIAAMCVVVCPLLARAWVVRHRSRLLRHLTDPDAD